MIHKYCNSLTHYSRRKTREVSIGGVPLGGDNPIRLQSMTTVDTMNTTGSAEQVLRMVDSGCEYVRITAPSVKEAQNLECIKNELRKRGCEVPLVADIHFTPNAAELAAKIVEKVRINPGNYADRKKFEERAYTDRAYADELKRIEDKFSPLVAICKAHGTAMRIGTNHGDTPLGMVESALEFIRICEKMDYKELVISMKSSNPLVMVQAYRLLVNKLDEENLDPYPLHLGVTEAGEAEDGRIKSAVGIGTLLEDGLGDTVRVSLTEEPEVEAPTARIMVDRLIQKKKQSSIRPIKEYAVNPFQYRRRSTSEVLNFGRENVPRIIADFSKINRVEMKDLKVIGHTYLPELDKWGMNDLGADYIYAGTNPLEFMLPNGLKEVVDYDTWIQADNNLNKHPYIADLKNVNKLHKELNFIAWNADDYDQTIFGFLEKHTNTVLMLHSDNTHRTAGIRRFAVELINRDIQVPVVLNYTFNELSWDELMIHAATDAGTLLADGIGDGVMLSPEFTPSTDTLKRYNDTAFGILQAVRTRITKTEYISCPSCGRTLLDM